MFSSCATRTNPEAVVDAMAMLIVYCCTGSERTGQIIVSHTILLRNDMSFLHSISNAKTQPSVCIKPRTQTKCYKPTNLPSVRVTNIRGKKSNAISTRKITPGCIFSILAIVFPAPVTVSTAYSDLERFCEPLFF